MLANIATAFHHDVSFSLRALESRAAERNVDELPCVSCSGNLVQGPNEMILPFQALTDGKELPSLALTFRRCAEERRRNMQPNLERIVGLPLSELFKFAQKNASLTRGTHTSLHTCS